MHKKVAVLIYFFAFISPGIIFATDQPSDSLSEGIIRPTSQEAEIFVFPIKPQRSVDAWKCPDSFVFGTKPASDSFEPDKPQPSKDTKKEFPTQTEEDKKDNEKYESKKPSEAIAIYSQARDFFHSTNSICISKGQQIKAFKTADIHKLMPCTLCFTRADKPPQFIQDESGGLDLASASMLFSNDELIDWISNNLPVKEPEFTSQHSLQTYSLEPISQTAMQELAKEIAAAARRKMWRVIKVKIKDPENDSQPEVSY